MGEPFGVVARSSVVNACFDLEDTLDVMHNLVSSLLEGCRYECVREEPSSVCFNYAFPIPLIIPMFPLHVHNPLFSPTIL